MKGQGMRKFSEKQGGFGLVEGLIIVAVLAVISIAGITLMNRNKKENASMAAVSTAQKDSSTSNPVAVDANKVGTTDGIDQLTNLDQSSESSIDTKHSDIVKSQVTSSNSSNNNISGAYDESTL
jgi:competence protein ComGC